MGRDDLNAAFRGPRRWPKVLGTLGSVALLLVGGVFVATMEGPTTFEPAGVVGELAATDWSLPVDAHGYRSFGNQIGEGQPVTHVALGIDGTLALALRGARASVLVWKAAHWRRTSISDSRAVTALAVDPEGRVHIGMQDGRLARIDPNGTIAVDPAMVAGRNSVVAFAFDPNSSMSAVMVAGGEVHTSPRPFELGSLHVVPMPEGRTRVASFDHAGVVVVAGDSGMAFSSSSSGWQPRPLTGSGNAAAFGRDGHGNLLLAQDNGHVFREDGHRWERVGRVGQTPIAVGDLPELGVVVIAQDGSFWTKPRDGDFAQAERIADATVTAGVIQGDNALAIADQQLVVRDSTGRWSSAELVAPPRDCTPLTFDAPVVAPLLRCGTDLYEVTEQGFEAREEPEGWNATRLAAATRRDGERLWVWQGNTLWQAKADRPLRWATRSVLRRLVPDVADWQEIAVIEAPVGPIRALDVHGSTLWAATRSGSVYRADTTGEVELMEVAAHESFAQLHGLGRVDDIRVVAHPAGALVIHDTDVGSRATFVSEQGLSPVALPPSQVFFRSQGRVLALTPTLLAELTPQGLVPVPITGLDPAALAGVTRDTIVRAVGEAFAFRIGGQLAQCKASSCRLVDVGPIISFAPREDGSVVIREVGGRVGILAWQAP